MPSRVQIPQTPVKSVGNKPRIQAEDIEPDMVVQAFVRMQSGKRFVVETSASASAASLRGKLAEQGASANDEIDEIQFEEDAPEATTWADALSRKDPKTGAVQANRASFVSPVKAAPATSAAQGADKVRSGCGWCSGGKRWEVWRCARAIG
jgi:hypothetical protein